MTMMNKCAKFHDVSPGGKKVKFNLPNAIELSDTADVTPCKRATWVAHLTNFSFEFFCAPWPENASQLLLYDSAKTVKKDQKLKSRGSCLKSTLRDFLRT